MSDLASVSTQELLAELGRRTGAAASSSPVVLYDREWFFDNPPIARDIGNGESLVSLVDNATTGNCVILASTECDRWCKAIGVKVVIVKRPGVPINQQTHFCGVSVTQEGFGAVVAQDELQVTIAPQRSLYNVPGVAIVQSRTIVRMIDWTAPLGADESLAAYLLLTPIVSR